MGEPHISNQRAKDITVAMPALDEERDVRDAVEATLRAFDDLGIDGEIVVVNDGSTDRTRDIVLELAGADSRVRLLDHERPCGIGASFWDAVEMARGDAICMIPGDNENEPAEILRYFRLLDHVDVIVPFVYNKEVRSRTRNALSYAYRTIVNASFGLTFNYTNGTVLCRRSLLQALPSRDTGFFFTTDILIRLCREGVLFAEVPYRLSARMSGVTKAVSLKALKQVARGYLHLLHSVHIARVEPVPCPEDCKTSLRRSAAERAEQGADAAQAA